MPVITNTWTGAVSTAWATAGNWSLAHAPLTTEAASIVDNGLANYPVDPLVPTSILDLAVNDAIGTTLSLGNLNLTGNVSLAGGTLTVGTVGGDIALADGGSTQPTFTCTSCAGTMSITATGAGATVGGGAFAHINATGNIESLTGSVSGSFVTSGTCRNLTLSGTGSVALGGTVGDGNNVSIGNSGAKTLTGTFTGGTLPNGFVVTGGTIAPIALNTVTVGNVSVSAGSSITIDSSVGTLAGLGTISLGAGASITSIDANGTDTFGPSGGKIAATVRNGISVSATLPARADVRIAVDRGDGLAGTLRTGLFPASFPASG